MCVCVHDQLYINKVSILTLFGAFGRGGRTGFLGCEFTSGLNFPIVNSGVWSCGLNSISGGSSGPILNFAPSRSETVCERGFGTGCTTSCKLFMLLLPGRRGIIGLLGGATGRWGLCMTGSLVLM